MMVLLENAKSDELSMLPECAQEIKGSCILAFIFQRLPINFILEVRIVFKDKLLLSQTFCLRQNP